MRTAIKAFPEVVFECMKTTPDLVVRRAVRYDRRVMNDNVSLAARLRDAHEVCDRCRDIAERRLISSRYSYH